MTHLINTAYSLVQEYILDQNPAGVDVFDVAESSIDASDMVEEALDEDTGDSALRAFVEEFGDEARENVHMAFESFIAQCVLDAERLEIEIKE